MTRKNPLETAKAILKKSSMDEGKHTEEGMHPDQEQAEMVAMKEAMYKEMSDTMVLPKKRLPK